MTTSLWKTTTSSIRDKDGWIDENGRGRPPRTIDGREEEVTAPAGRRSTPTRCKRLLSTECSPFVRPTPESRLRRRSRNRSAAGQRIVPKYIDEERNWRAGETISQYEAEMVVEPARR